MTEQIREWGAADAARHIRVPGPQDNKYSHGVLGVVTGSEKYPGAAVLGVEAAHRTGIGMVRFLGEKAPAGLALARRPETVTVSGAVDAWIVGSGMESTPGLNPELPALAHAALGLQPVVVDAGGLGFLGHVSAPAIITPHEGELERLVPRNGSTREEWVASAADQLGVVVVLKGHETLVATPEEATGGRFLVKVTSPTAWLATAGTGDVLAGIIAAVVATHSVKRVPSLHELAELAATGVFLHGKAAELAGEDGPFPALDVAESVGRAVAWVLSEGKH
ncbi:ADP-dependent NAD(P)H-hydrate dehydratase [Aurantimicrobium photophilum]|uniref:ADP-dependent (S)-NAD(P)H-hydrate dehydratase n=1 Tax=Aurantimicrobium photophilum TaxID=1987356 RepID=A0A2Z3RWU7_9MICO|nr:ADP/ATP-dependent (S)-NAD(P)H-hydrate dehydratase [Aurantimicrobium photophilum]AWR21021.1 Bifunctional NAD(P)H-hydrate repair enzyme Nnr [Aurantimicrobium photophilum]